MNREARALAVRIKRPAAEAYEFLSLPENFPKWASGLGASLRRNGDDWVVETSEGPATVRFSERNAYGVLDHQIRLLELNVMTTLRGNDLSAIGG